MPTITLQTDSATYPIFIDPLMSPASAESHASTAPQNPQITCDSKALIISNPKVAGLYLDKILPRVRASEVFVCIIPDGEMYKNMASIEQILACAFQHRLDRKSLMIALGGGVISDMVGFASGIYERGIDFVSIPTTLLAQVDASVGGKCGINNEWGKNLVGLFHQPKAVYVDSAFLSTLPRREYSAGIAEMIKMAVCFDAREFEALEKAELNDLATLNTHVKSAIEIKAKVVAQDERESGIRAGLNYGHTFAHVIENLTHYARFLHGEAVGIGMRMANALAVKLNMLSEAESNRIDALLARYGLDMHYEIEDVEAFYQLFFLDKKSSQSKLRFVLPRGLGQCAILDDIPKEKIIEVLEAYKSARSF
ncbi:3-dehydroquinate synthase [Helicobacter sp. CLO-3]|uniref:3-dehydroquinate synthase n=1 Tax=unclassified Helicobacter TaxID=2593540 RepID=UPI0008058EEA|nr:MULTISPECIES: 3-dehydroquinate synthase [unclassified Helicobacter]OBV29583.1 3-dehydroquinate synthase [Helicobacter sp. CLO-3]OHU84092.1 3-dehydroquinate synthase [Helicobacter sp. CLO-3]